MPGIYSFKFEDVQRADDETTSTTYYGGAVKVTRPDGRTFRLLVSGNDRGGTVWDAVVEQFEKQVLGRPLTDAEQSKLEEAGVSDEQSVDVVL